MNKLYIVHSHHGLDISLFSFFYIAIIYKSNQYEGNKFFACDTGSKVPATLSNSAKLDSHRLCVSDWLEVNSLSRNILLSSCFNMEMIRPGIFDVSKMFKFTWTE